MSPSSFQIMKKGSKTYFYSSLFFPKEIRKDVFILYAFVRTVDNFVDTLPQDKEGFHSFKKSWKDYLITGHSPIRIVSEFGELFHRMNFEKKWVEAFFTSMSNDLTKKKYITFKETEEYMYGSAEVIGLMMAKILHLPSETYKTASLQGRAMQYINFIRDIAEDNELGRTYIPHIVLQKYSLSDLREKTARENPKQFIALIRSEINRYRKWQQNAFDGFKFISKKSRIPIETAAIMYMWSAEQIYNNPFIVYSQKIKPSIFRIASTALLRTLNNGKVF